MWSAEHGKVPETSANDTGEVSDVSQATGSELATINARLTEVRTVVLDPNGRYLLASGAGQTEILDLKQGTSLAVCEGETSDDPWAFSGGVRFFATAGPDASARIYEVETGRLLARFRLGDAPRGPARFNAAGDRLLVQAGDWTELWDTDLEKRTPAEIASKTKSFNTN